MILSGWRLASPEFANSPSQMMSGEGAYLNGGRWNSKGTAMVYLGNSLAQASMELLVHIGRPAVLNAYVKLEVFFDEALLDHIDREDLPDDWASPTMASAVQTVGDTWVKTQSSVILQVPSAVVNGEFNFLVNPLHPYFKKWRKGSSW